MNSFEISKKQAIYIVSFLPMSQELLERLNADGFADERGSKIKLKRCESEEIRDLLTTRLATVGFDHDYNLNDEGRMLEELIDLFFVE